MEYLPGARQERFIAEETDVLVFRMFVQLHCVYVCVFCIILLLLYIILYIVLYFPRNYVWFAKMETAVSV